jgi:hypothetical protein
MPGAIVGLLTSLPQLISLFNGLGTGLTKLWAWLEQVSGNDPTGHIVKIGAAVSQLEKAQTPEEHSDAAKTLADLLRGLPHP